MKPLTSLLALVGLDSDPDRRRQQPHGSRKWAGKATPTLGVPFSRPDPVLSRLQADMWLVAHPLKFTRKGRRQVRRAFATIREDVALTAELKRIETVEARRGGRYELRRWDKAFNHDFDVPGFSPGLPKARRRAYEREVDAERRETVAALRAGRLAA